jgi:hypothetical protein
MSTSPKGLIAKKIMSASIYMNRMINPSLEEKGRYLNKRSVELLSLACVQTTGNLMCL